MHVHSFLNNQSIDLLINSSNAWLVAFLFLFIHRCQLAMSLLNIYRIVDIYVCMLRYYNFFAD